MAPQTSPALFVGWKIESGLRYRQTLLVINYDRVRKTGFQARNIKAIPQKEVHFPSELVFPFAEARKVSINQMRPLSSPADMKLPSQLPWSDEAADAPAAVEAVAPPPAPVAKRFRITPFRIIQHKGTVGCRACELLDPKRGHTRGCKRGAHSDAHTAKHTTEQKQRTSPVYRPQ